MAKKPNIVLVLTDQMRRSAMSCSGDPNVSTPNIDRLAGEGVRFSNSCSVYPVCVPARFSLLTGQYPHTRDIPGIEWRMSPCEKTIAHVLNEAGYETCYIGKWHLYGGFARGQKDMQIHIGTTFIPSRYRGGFQRWRGFELRNSHFDTYYHVDDDPTPRHIDGYQADGLFDITMQYINQERNCDKPFFVILSVEAPHPPFEVPEKFKKRFKDKDLILPPNIDCEAIKGKKFNNFYNDYKTYYAMIENIDYNVGRLISFLQQQGLKDDTAIIFYSDHGELMGSHGLKAKNSPYEESVGIPLIISHPKGGVLQGQVLDIPTSTIDIFPTIEAMAGLAPSPDNPGLNLMPYITGENNQVPREGILLESVANPGEGRLFYGGGWRVFRTERYKYVVKGKSYEGKPYQLFDLACDPYEMNNLIDDPNYRDIAYQLEAELRQYLKNTEDDYNIVPQ